VWLGHGVALEMVVSIMGIPPNGWFIMENSIKMDDLGVLLFQDTTKWQWKVAKHEGFNGHIIVIPEHSGLATM